MVLHKIIFVSVVIGLLAGVSYISASQFVQEENTKRESIVIPLKIHIVEDESGSYTSLRDEQNILNLFDKVNTIWSQANIYFQIEEIVVTDLSSGAVPDTLNGNAREIYYHENFDQERINVFFTKTLGGINGIALRHIDSALVADFTTVNDFRTTAHELGHLFGLLHVEPSERLMAQGRNGELLVEWEIEEARENSLRYT